MRGSPERSAVVPLVCIILTIIAGWAVVVLIGAGMWKLFG